MFNLSNIEVYATNRTTSNIALTLSNILLKHILYIKEHGTMAGYVNNTLYTFSGNGQPHEISEDDFIIIANAVDTFRQNLMETWNLTVLELDEATSFTEIMNILDTYKQNLN